MRLSLLLSIGLLSFVAGLIVHAPAATLYGWFAPADSPVVVAGLSGTPLQGEAASLRYQQRPALSSLRWRLQPASLLRGRLAYHLQSLDPRLSLDGYAATGFGGAHLNDFKLGSGLREVLAIAGQAFLPVDGQAMLDLSQLHLRDGWPQDAKGTLRLANLAWTLARDPVVLGDFEASFDREQDDLVALVRTVSGPLDVNGDARLRADRRYSMHLQVRPKPDAPPMVQNLVRSIGPVDAQGYFHIRYEGQVPAPAPAP